MERQTQCLCDPADVLLVPCGGGSDCGQATSEAAVALTTEGAGEIFCLAGIAAHVPEVVEIARQAKRIVVMDGCGLQCALKTVRHAGLVVTDHIDLSAEDLPKSRRFDRVQQNVLFIVKLAKQRLRQAPQGGIPNE